VQVHIFRSLPWNIKQWEWSLPKLTWLLKLRQLLRGINRRNYRKICLIDRRLAFVGSFNISKRHLPREQGGEGWRGLILTICTTPLTVSDSMTAPRFPGGFFPCFISV
jgi:hypothetical protein